MIVLIIFLDVIRCNLCCYCWSYEFMNPYSPLKLFLLQMIHSTFLITKSDHHIYSIRTQYSIDFSQHFARICIRTFTALLKMTLTMTESKVPLSIMASNEFSANYIALTSICIYLKFGPFSLYNSFIALIDVCEISIFVIFS